MISILPNHFYVHMTIGLKTLLITFPNSTRINNLLINNFISCHRFRLTRCRRPVHFPVTAPSAYTTVHFHIYDSSPDSVFLAAARNCLIIPGTEDHILTWNCARNMHNSRRKAVRNDPDGLSSSKFMKLSQFPARFAKYSFCV